MWDIFATNGIRLRPPIGSEEKNAPLNSFFVVNPLATAGGPTPVRLVWYCQLNSEETKLATQTKMNPPFVIWLINDRLDANRLFPYGESRLHYF
ncbi:MAG TPA: hypothetical protein VLQ90_02780, partial [Pyrinomonadaceae bacterium]|nr:hypothetical protein [Pyrinomonadaceae bacterium]